MEAALLRAEEAARALAAVWAAGEALDEAEAALARRSSEAVRGLFSRGALPPSAPPPRVRVRVRLARPPRGPPLPPPGGSEVRREEEEGGRRDTTRAPALAQEAALAATKKRARQPWPVRATPAAKRVAVTRTPAADVLKETGLGDRAARAAAGAADARERSPFGRFYLPPDALLHRPYATRAMLDAMSRHGCGPPFRRGDVVHVPFDAAETARAHRRAGEAAAGLGTSDARALAHVVAAAVPGRTRQDCLRFLVEHYGWAPPAAVLLAPAPPASAAAQCDGPRLAWGAGNAGAAAAAASPERARRQRRREARPPASLPRLLHLRQALGPREAALPAHGRPLAPGSAAPLPAGAPRAPRGGRVRHWAERAVASRFARLESGIGRSRMGDPSAVEWRLNARAPVQNVVFGRRPGVDAHLLAVAASDAEAEPGASGCVVVYDTDRARETRLAGVTGAVDVLFTPCGRRLVAASDTGRVASFDTARLGDGPASEFWTAGGVVAVAAGRGGAVAATGSGSSAVHLCGEVVPHAASDRRPPFAMAFGLAAASDTLLVGRRGGGVAEVRQGDAAWGCGGDGGGKGAAVTSVAASPDGTFAYTAAGQRGVFAHDPRASGASGRRVFSLDVTRVSIDRRLLRGDGTLDSVSFSPCGVLAACGGSHDNAIYVFDTRRGDSPVAALEHDEAADDRSDGVAFDWSADSARLVSSSCDGTVRLWDAAGGAQIAAVRPGQYVALSDEQRPIESACISHDSLRVACGSVSGRVFLFSAAML